MTSPALAHFFCVCVCLFFVFLTNLFSLISLCRCDMCLAGDIVGYKVEDTVQFGGTEIKILGPLWAEDWEGPV